MVNDENYGSERVSPFSVASVLLRHRRLMVGVPLFTILAAVLYLLLSGDEFVAESAFVPQGISAGGSRISSLAEQFGVSFGSGAQPGDDVATYAELLKSREVLTAVASSTYEVTPPDDPVRSGTLMDLYEVEGTPEDRLRMVVRGLDEAVVANADAVTGIVRVTTRAPWPDLAVQINRRLLEQVSDFNLRRRQSQARAEREFVEARLEDKRTELQGAEATLSRFLEENRRYQDSPPLELEFRRLQRQVDMQQAVYVDLASAFEQAQIAEVRNTPVMTIIDNPEGSQRRVQPGLMISLALALVLGLGVAATLAFALDYLRVQREMNPREFQQFAELGRAVLPSLGSAGRGAQAARGAGAATDERVPD